MSDAPLWEMKLRAWVEDENGNYIVRGEGGMWIMRSENEFSDEMSNGYVQTTAFQFNQAPVFREPGEPKERWSEFSTIRNAISKSVKDGNLDFTQWFRTVPVQHQAAVHEFIQTVAHEFYGRKDTAYMRDQLACGLASLIDAYLKGAFSRSRRYL